MLHEIRQAGSEIYGRHRVKLNGNFLCPKHAKVIVVCPLCRQAYPESDSAICRGCQGEAPSSLISQ